MFFKKAVLKNFHRKTPVLDSVFIKAFTPATLSKKGVFCEYCKIVKNTYKQLLLVGKLFSIPE